MGHVFRFVLVIATLAGVTATLSPVLAEPPAANNTNLLTNPGFESPFAKQCCHTQPGFDPTSLIDEVQVANGWRGWWLEPGGPDHPTWCANCPAWHRPEYRESAPFANRIRSGENSQKYFTFYSTHQGGMYQRVFNIQPGQRLRFSVYMHAWSSLDDNLQSTIADNDLAMKVGIDPFGGVDPYSGNVVWSPAFNAYDTWALYSVEAVAQASSITVFTHSMPRWGMKHNDIYVDDASLITVSSATPAATAVPTATPLPPTTAPSATLAIALASPVTAVTVTAIPTTTATATTIAPPPTAASAPSSLSTYTIQRGETLFSIAVRFGTSVSTLQSLNNLASPSRIFAGQVIFVPSAAASAPTAVPPAAQVTAAPAVAANTGSVSYTIQQGDTLFSIARRYGTTVAAILTANGISNAARVLAGQVIIIPVAASISPGQVVSQPTAAPTAVIASPGGATYTIQRGDTFFNISQRFGFQVAALVAANPGVSVTRLAVGQIINLPGAATTATSATNTYVVQPGDTLRLIAAKLGTSVAILQSLNSLTDPNRILVGQTLIVP